MKRQFKHVAVLILFVFSVFANFCLFVPSVRAWTPLEGHITQDTTLTLANSPYRLVRDVVVDSGVKLTIEPGVTVQFADGFSLFVNGVLNAIGTDTHEIIFTSSRPSPTPGVWNTIKINGTGLGRIEHCNIQYGQNGITKTASTSMTIKHSEISNCSNAGIELHQWDVLLHGNSIHENHYGVFIVGPGEYGQVLSNVTILENEVSWNDVGVFLGRDFYVGGSKIANVTIEGNNFHHNGHEGIRVSSLEVANISIKQNTVAFQGEQGIYLRSERAQGIEIIGNVIHDNTISGVSSRTDETFDLNVTSNNIYSNGFGFHLSTHGSSALHTLIRDNTISNNRDGVFFDIDDNVGSPINITNNLIQSNSETGISLVYEESFYYPTLSEDFILSNNSIAYSQYGIYFRTIRTRRGQIFFNSIQSNEFGIVFADSSRGNIATNNDIVGNTKGMVVSGGATVNAENNFWGHSSGPYHESLNPEGEGNSVNGDGTDLDFIPWSSSPFGPIIEPALLIVNVSLVPTSTSSGGEVSVSVHVTNGTVAVDDVMVQLSSDKGGSFSKPSGNTNSNGDFESSYAAPSVSEETTVKITATASKVGYIDNSDYKYVTVYPSGTLFLSVTVTADPNTVESGGTSTITVRLTDGTNAVSDATVALSSTNGGSLSPTSGTTDTNGYSSSTYTAPSVTTETTIIISANVTKTGYISGQGQTQITVNVTEEDSTLWIYLAIFLVVLAFIIGMVAIARRKRRKLETEEPQPRGNPDKRSAN